MEIKTQVVRIFRRNGSLQIKVGKRELKVVDHFKYLGSVLTRDAYFKFRPRGKESTKVRKSQIKGKESENYYQELKRSPKDRHTQTYGNCFEIF